MGESACLHMIYMIMPLSLHNLLFCDNMETNYLSPDLDREFGLIPCYGVPKSRFFCSFCPPSPTFLLNRT